MAATKFFRTFSVTLASAAALSLACGGSDGDGGSSATSGTLICDEGKGVCFTGNGYIQLCLDENDNRFWYVSNDGICFSEEGYIQLCSPTNSNRISTVNGELVSCGEPGDAACTEEAHALCDELFTGSPLPSCDECGANLPRLKS